MRKRQGRGSQSTITLESAHLPPAPNRNILRIRTEKATTCHQRVHKNKQRNSTERLTSSISHVKTQHDTDKPEYARPTFIDDTKATPKPISSESPLKRKRIANWIDGTNMQGRQGGRHQALQLRKQNLSQQSTRHWHCYPAVRTQIPEQSEARSIHARAFH